MKPALAVITEAAEEDATDWSDYSLQKFLVFLPRAVLESASGPLFLVQV